MWPKCLIQKSCQLEIECPLYATGVPEKGSLFTLYWDLLDGFFLTLGVKTGKAFLTPEMFPSTSVSKHVVLSSQACRFDFFIFNLLEREWRQKWDL